jgi:hypothetical protein
MWVSPENRRVGSLSWGACVYVSLVCVCVCARARVRACVRAWKTSAGEHLFKLLLAHVAPLPEVLEVKHDQDIDEGVPGVAQPLARVLKRLEPNRQQRDQHDGGNHRREKYGVDRAPGAVAQGRAHLSKSTRLGFRV